MAFRVNWIFCLAVCVVLLTLLADDTEAKGGRGGGSRGGSRGGYRSTSRSTSRSSSSRSSSSSSRGGSRISSAYVTTPQAARYTRAYGTSRGYYYVYYSQYFFYSGSYGYSTRRRPSGDTQVCVNYEASDNGTYMGVFACPLPFEPSKFTSCCGADYAEYCCKPYDNSWVYIVVGVVIGGIILIIVAVFVASKVKAARRRRSERETDSTSTPPVTYETPKAGAFPSEFVYQENGAFYGSEPALDKPTGGNELPPPYPTDGPAMPLPSYGVSSPNPTAPDLAPPAAGYEQAPPYGRPQ